MSPNFGAAHRAAEHARAEVKREQQIAVGLDFGLHAEQQVRPGATFDLLEGGAAEGNRLIALGGARLPTAGEIAAFEAAK